MQRANSIKDDLGQIRTVQELTEVFESIASIKISKIRDTVVESKLFFSKLWRTYRELRINPDERLVKRSHDKQRGVLVAVTSEGKLSGGVVERVFESTMKFMDDGTPKDIIVLGSQGAARFEHHQVPVVAAYHLPESDNQFDVRGVVSLLQQYDQISVIYQTYESLRVQKVTHIELISAIRELGDEADENTSESEVVSTKNYVIEPNIDEIAQYLESLMMEVALRQVIMEAKLAQYASRFNAMNAAKHRASDLERDFNRMYHRAKRNESDERLKETMKVLLRRAS